MYENLILYVQPQPDHRSSSDNCLDKNFSGINKVNSEIRNQILKLENYFGHMIHEKTWESC